MVKNKRKYIALVASIVVICGLAVFTFNTVSLATSFRDQAIIAAHNNLHNALENCIRPCYKNFNFKNEEDVTKASLGEPIEDCCLSASNYNSGKDIESQIKKSPDYIFPVVVNGRPVVDLTMALINGEWVFSDVGGNISRKVYNLAKSQNVTNIKIVNVLFSRFLLGRKANSIVGFFPDNEGNGFKTNVLYNADSLKKYMKIKKAEILKIKNQLKHTNKSAGYGGYSLPTKAELEKEKKINHFAQESIINRMIKSAKFELGL